MSWIITPEEKTPLDQDYRNVSLLLHGDGANGSTTIVDNSPTPKTVTAVGNAQISTAQSKFSGASIAFDGSGDAATVPRTADCDFGTGDFTIEAWIRFSALNLDCSIVAGRGPTNGGSLMFAAITGASGNNDLRVGRNLVAWDLIANTSWSADTWYHVAVTRASGILRLFKNGVVLNTGTYAGNYTLAFPTDSTYAIGARQKDPNSSTLGQFFNGYIDDLRITKGVARYTSNFTPPTAPFPDF